MAYTTKYSGNGGDNAGGFMASSQAEGQGTKKYGKDSLRPVTIKQLQNAHHPNADAEHFIIDDCETTQVTFVAQIRNVSAQATNYTYKMDDGSGTVEVKVWVDAEVMNTDFDNPQKEERDKLVEGAYARVFGRLKEFNNKRHVGATVIRVITDHNEIHYHLLEATYVHLLATRGPPGDASKSTSNGTNGHSTANNEGMLPASTSHSAKKVWQMMKTAPPSMEGYHVQNISSRTNLDVNEVMKGTDELVSLGLIYTTVDESTFAIMDC